jgi:hypothetical protein
VELDKVELDKVELDKVELDNVELDNVELDKVELDKRRRFFCCSSSSDCLLYTLCKSGQNISLRADNKLTSKNTFLRQWMGQGGALLCQRYKKVFGCLF